MCLRSQTLGIIIFVLQFSVRKESSDMKKKNLWINILGIIYGLLLLAFTVFVLLDTFVISPVDAEVPSPAPGQIYDMEGR